MKQKLKRWIATFLVTLTVISGIATAGAPLIHAELTENGQHQLLCDTDSNQNQTGNSNNSDGTGPNSGGTSGRWKHPPTYYNIPDLGDGKIQANDIASGRAVCSRIAKAVGKATGIDPAILMGQMWAETSWGTAPAALSARNGDHCITGIGVVAGTPGVSTGAGHAEGDGAYGHYDSWQHFAMAWACILDTDVSEKGHHDPATFVRDLKAHKYFTDSNVAGYIARVEAGMQKYKNGDGAGDGAILNGAGSAADSGAAGANTQNSGSQDETCTEADSSSSSNLLNIAKKLLGYFTYSMGNRRDVAKNGDLNSLKSVADVKKDGQTDCSGFVWLCFKLGGYNVPANMGWFTVPMQSDARGPHKWLKEVPESQAKAGDIVICGSGAGAGGHTAILAENWHGDDTKIIQEGGQGGGGGVNEGTFGLSFGSMGNNNRVFAEPVK